MHKPVEERKTERNMDPENGAVGGVHAYREHRKALWQAYGEATRQALAALERDDLERMQKQLEERDRLIAEIDEIGRCLAGAFAADDERDTVRPDGSAPRRQTPASDSIAGPMQDDAELQRLLRRIREMDERLLAALHARKEEAAAKLEAIRKGKQLQSRYRISYQPVDGVFYDKRR
ncbi:hypothetical protein BSNK01_18450 [Bacillaceae bacterium]